MKLKNCRDMVMARIAKKRLTTYLLFAQAATVIVVLLGAPSFPANGNISSHAPDPADTASQAVNQVLLGKIAHLDAKAHTLDVQNADGALVPFFLSPRIHNVAALKVGDTVSVGFVRAEVLSMLPRNPAFAKPGDETAGTAAMPPVAAAPEHGPHSARRTTLDADVMSIDFDNRLVVLKCPRGRYVEARVRRDKLDAVHVGDHVTVEYATAVAASVTPQG